MKCLLFLFLLLCGVIPGYSQSVILSGVVKDSTGAPLEMANVVAVNRETQNLDAFGVTNSGGRYKLQLSREKTYNIRISYLGLKTEEFEFTAREDSSKDIVLTQDTNELDEVEVVYEMPVTVRGDTIVYNADAFNRGTEKKLKDVLKNLPGVEINSDGEIEVEGKKVSRVKVEGKDFFEGDSKLASENIPANAVDQVEVLRNFNEVSQMKGLTNDDENIALNIKLKEGKKNFWFGEITAGAGPDGRYLAHPKLFYYSPKYSLNLITDFNNIGELPFTMRDYFNFTGGFRTFNHRGGTSFNIASNDLGLSLMQNNRAREIDTRFGAFNFSYSPTDTWDLGGFAIYSYSGTDMQTNASRTFIESGETELSTTNTHQKSRLGLAKLNFVHRPDESLQLDYDVLLKMSDQQENTDRVSVSNVTDSIAENKDQAPFSLTQSANLYYTLNERNIFAAEARHLYQNEDPFYNAIRDIQPFQGMLPFDDSQDRYNINQERRVKTNRIDAMVDYYFLTGKKSHINFTVGASYSHQNFSSAIFQILDDNSKLELEEYRFNNEVIFGFSDVFAGFHYKLVSGIFTFNPGFTVHSYKAKNEQLGTSVTDNKFAVLPDVYINLQFKKAENLRFTYGITREFTDINKLAAGYVFNDYNSIYSGNRELESALYHKLSLDYFSFNMFNFTNIFASLSYNKRIDALKSSGSIEGINRVNTSVNSNFEDDILTAMGRYERRFNKYKASARANLSYSRFNNIVNQTRQISKSFTQDYQLSLATNFHDLPNVEIGYGLNINSYDNGGNSTIYYTVKPFVRIDAAFLKNFIFTADYTYNHYRNKEETVKNEYAFLNADLSYRGKDSKWEYSVGVTNVLNNEDLNQDSFNELYFSSSRYLVQPRYVLFKVKYDL
ncbi:carboxypeptidase-like regulatory domain-containing protein [Sinomicrobium weinanense]|uniref:Carboxypeptidase-like regulatory domain-containing protein n=1 Tax=Sinomicrobium weinanense TaxID=2842200 RepID=A0A926Q0M6_9FLAO|nr:carboxypeptidase-like regulatory domain-containing protein [Sinomicrobium weinanense]MBC9794933.1 carboxypeptidase-like regulatory domain-containing protein [Sinomicrobium weinanense]MBU3125704.1 carboxypeptidase-like regulatory domain-containing protein [Sinomicrobium weinanense]